MPSTPPTPRDQTAEPLPRLAGDPSKLDDGVVFFCVEGASMDSCRTLTGPGTITFRSEVHGVISEVRPDAWVLCDGVRDVLIRHLLPAPIDLTALVGASVRVSIDQRYLGRGRATIRAEIRSESGRLLLLAWDGRMPQDGDIPSLVVRSSVDSAGVQRVAMAHERGVTTSAVPGRAAIEIEGREVDALSLRLGPDDLSLVLLAR